MSTITPAATFPVASPFNTSPSYSGTFIPTLWSAKLNQKFYAATTFGDVANTNWQGDIGAMGDSVIINNIPTITVSAYTVGSSLNYTAPTPNTIELNIDTGRSFAVNISDVLAHQSKPNLMSMFGDDAAQQLKISIDRDCWAVTFNQGAAANQGANAGALTGAYNLGVDTAPVVLSPSNILQVITAMGAVLDEQNIPETERFLVLTPYERQLLMQSNLAQAQFMGDPTSILRNGKIGQIDRFTVYISNLLPTGAAGQSYTDSFGNSTAQSGALKRHAIIAGHRSALSFASQVTKIENLRNPNDFGDLVRGLNVYGRKVTKPEALVFANVQ